MKFGAGFGRWERFFALIPHMCHSCGRCFWLEVGKRMMGHLGLPYHKCNDCA